LAYWDPRSTTPVFKLTSEDGRFQVGGITALGVNPSSTLAVVGGSNGTVCVVSLSKAEVIAVLGGHTEGEAIEAVTFVDVANSSSGPGVVVTGAMDGKICIWDLTTMRLRSTLEHKVSPVS
jgi:ribosome assembly protein SQT1